MNIEDIMKEVAKINKELGPDESAAPLRDNEVPEPLPLDKLIENERLHRRRDELYKELHKKIAQNLGQ